VTDTFCGRVNDFTPVAGFCPHLRGEGIIRALPQQCKRYPLCLFSQDISNCQTVKFCTPFIYTHSSMTIKLKYSPKKDDNILECFAFYSFGLTEGDNYPVEKWNNLKQMRK